MYPPKLISDHTLVPTDLEYTPKKRVNRQA